MADIVYSDYGSLRPDKLEEDILRNIVSLELPELKEKARVVFGTMVLYLSGCERWSEAADDMREFQRLHPVRLILLGTSGVEGFPSEPTMRVACALDPQKKGSSCFEEILLPVEPDDEATANGVASLVDADLPVYFLPFAPVSQELLRHLKEFVDVFVMPEPKSIYGSQRESIGGLYSRFTGEEEVCDIRWPSILDAGRKFIEQVGRYALESNVFIHCAHDEMSFHTSVLSAGFISLVSSDDARHRACANEFGFTVYTPRGRGVSVIQNGDIAWGSGRITFPGRPGLSTRWEGFLDHIRIEDEPGERVRPVHAYSSLHDSLVNLLPMPDEYVPKDLLARVGEIYRALERERSVLCFPRPDACGRACAFDMRTAVESAVRERGVANVVLAGGSTPKMMFKALNEPEMAGVDWRKVRFFFGDERPVGPNHERSNYRLARENLFGPLGIPQENVYRIRGEADDPDAEAARYEKLVRDELGSEPRFDWVMLGMGSDAHTASLFPSSDVLEEKVRLVATGISPDGEPRVTMTYRLLNSARRVAFLVTGEHKADALGKVLEGGDMTRLPAVAVRPWGRLAYFCDKAAARRI